MRYARIAIALGMLGIGFSLHAARDDSRTFVREMLNGIGATRVECPAEAVEVAKSRDLDMICARFDGDFGRFQSRFEEQLERFALIGRPDGSGLLPPATPRTAWEQHDGVYERIYGLGRSSVGVRFDRGDVIVIYR